MGRTWISAVAALLYVTTFAMGAPAAQTVLHSTPIDQFHHWSDGELAAMIKQSGSTFLSDHESFFIQELNRTKSGEVEQHDHWNDYFVIQQGVAKLTYGGTASGTVPKGMGEWRGGKIEGGRTVALYAGELIVIPAGTPHLVTLEPGKNLRYLVFKARQ